MTVFKYLGTPYRSAVDWLRSFVGAPAAVLRGLSALLQVSAGAAVLNRPHQRLFESSLEPAWKVLILGLDGATWDVIDPLRRAGSPGRRAR